MENFDIIDSLAIYSAGALITTIPAGIDTAKYNLFIGLKSYSLTQSTSFSFSFKYGPADAAFPVNSAYN